MSSTPSLIVRVQNAASNQAIKTSGAPNFIFVALRLASRSISWAESEVSPEHCMQKL